MAYLNTYREGIMTDMSYGLRDGAAATSPAGVVDPSSVSLSAKKTIHQLVSHFIG